MDDLSIPELAVCCYWRWVGSKDHSSTTFVGIRMILNKVKGGAVNVMAIHLALVHFFALALTLASSHSQRRPAEPSAIYHRRHLGGSSGIRLPTICSIRLCQVKQVNAIRSSIISSPDMEIGVFSIPSRTSSSSRPRLVFSRSPYMGGWLMASLAEP